MILRPLVGIGLCSQEWVDLALLRVAGEIAEVPAEILGLATH